MASKKQIDQTWDKAKKVRGENPDVWRKGNNFGDVEETTLGTLLPTMQNY